MDVDDIVSGATYVPIETAMRFIRKQSSSTVKTYYDTESQNYSEFFSQSGLYHCSHVNGWINMELASPH